jgi:hypothetical protein
MRFVVPFWLWLMVMVVLAPFAMAAVVFAAYTVAALALVALLALVVRGVRRMPSPAEARRVKVERREAYDAMCDRLGYERLRRW